MTGLVRIRSGAVQLYTQHLVVRTMTGLDRIRGAEGELYTQQLAVRAMAGLVIIRSGVVQFLCGI